ncbi:unnamed protein product [Closterium sp. Naga37s-1]|nr:unnamed protein product [Closterium sp. Naga37s-1]
MASLSAVFTSNPAAIAATSASGGATCFPRPSRSAPAPFLTSSVLPRRRTITTGLNRSSFPTWHGLRAPTSLRRPGIVPFPSLLRASFGTRGNDLYDGSSSRLPLLAVAAAGDAGGGNWGGTGESEGATGESEAVGELGESGTIREEQPREEEQTGEQAAAEVPPVASDQPNQRLTAHLDLSEVKRQLQRSNERTAESLKHLRSRLHASNEWTAKHLKKSNQQTRENLKHLRNRLHASNEWTLSHLKKGHQWMSEHLRESNERTMEHLKASNERTREQLQHLIHSEQLHHLEEHLDVIGKIPQGLRGRFIRNGPNPQLPPSSPALYHWFDGDGMVHSVNFHPPEKNFHPDGENFHSSRVSYGRRYIRTTGWQEERAAGRALFGGLQQVGLGANHLLLAAMNLLGLRQQDAPMWNMTKNVSNNHFIQHAGRLLSLWEAGLPYSLDPSTLHTKGVHSFDDTWRSGMTAHPKVDPVTNHMMIYGYNLTHKPYLRYGVVDPSGSLVHATDLDLPHPVMMHDFAITEHYSIFLDFPLRFQLDKVIQSHGKAKPFVFDPSKPSCIGILPRFGSNPDMRWFTVEPGFCLHVVNAFEEPSSPDSSSSTSPTFSSSPSSPAIVLRVIRFPAFSALGLAELADELACDEVARLYEYRLDLQSGAVEERFVCKVCCDFPSINPNFTGRLHRFAYSARFTAQPGPGTTVPSFNAIMKHDFAEGTYQVHTLPPGRFCGEPVFAPRHHFQGSSRSQSGEARSDEVGMGRDVVGLGADAVGMDAEEEDDGWVLAHVWNEEEMKSEVIVLDAMNLDKQPLARVILPKRVPYGFHGTFLPD